MDEKHFLYLQVLKCFKPKLFNILNTLTNKNLGYRIQYNCKYGSGYILKNLPKNAKNIPFYRPSVYYHYIFLL